MRAVSRLARVSLRLAQAARRRPRVARRPQLPAVRALVLVRVLVRARAPQRVPVRARARARVRARAQEVGQVGHEASQVGRGGPYLCFDAHFRHVVLRAWHDLRIRVPCVAHLVDAGALVCDFRGHACVRALGRDPVAPLVRRRPRHPLPPAEEEAWVRARVRVRARARARVHDVSHGHGARVARLAQ